MTVYVLSHMPNFVAIPVFHFYWIWIMIGKLFMKQSPEFQLSCQWLYAYDLSLLLGHYDEFLGNFNMHHSMWGLKRSRIVYCHFLIYKMYYTTGNCSNHCNHPLTLCMTDGSLLPEGTKPLPETAFRGSGQRVIRMAYVMYIIRSNFTGLTPSDLVTPYGDKDLGKHWFR